MKYFLLLLTLLAGSAYPSIAQRPPVLHFTEQDGLPSNVVYDVFQDSKGFIWIGTNQGVCRFDGHQFQTYTIKDGLPDNDVFTIREDSYGRCWLVCYKPLPCYISEGKVFNAENDVLCKKIADADIEYKSYYKDKNGRDCLVGKQLCFLGKTDISYPFQHIYSKGGKADYFNDAGNEYYFSDGELYSLQNGTSQLLYRFEHTRMLASCGLKGHLFMAAIVNGIGNVLYDLVVRNDTVVHMSRMRTNQFCYSLYAFSDTEVFMTTEKGLISYNTVTHTFRHSDLIQQRLAINRMFEDNEHNYWFTTIDDGVYLMVNSEAKLYDATHGLKNDHVMFANVLPDSQLVATYDNGTFSILKNGHRKDYAIPQRGPQNRIVYVYPFGAHQLLVGADEGAYVLNVHTGETKLLVQNAQKDATCRGNHCYIAGAGSAYRVDLSSKRIIWQERTTAITEDSNGCVWLGTLNGLYYEQKGEIKKFDRDKLLSAAHITSICICSGMLIIATHKNGLYTWDGKDLNSLTTDNGLSSNTCRKVIGDNEGHLWLCTDEGLNKITFTNDGSYSVYHYTRADGLIYPNINHLSAYGNNIFAATSRGILMLDKAPTHRIKPPLIYITAVQTKDTLIINPVSLHVDYTNHDFQVSFTGISFANGNTVNYRYILEGPGTDTVYTAIGSVNISALWPGYYTFTAWASAGNSGWSEVPARFSFRISPPFWLAPWFLTSVAALLIGAIWQLYRTKLKKLKLKEEGRMDRQKQIAQLEIDALRAQINPHFMFNVLTSVQSFYSKNDERKANYYMTSFAHLVRKLLVNSKDHWILLSEEIAMLRTYLELEQMRFNNSFKFEIIVKGGLNADSTYFPSMLIQPYAENAVKHGLSHLTDNSGILIICFEQKNNGLLCTVEDNGIGIDTVLGNKPAGHQSMGMNISERRIDFLNQLYQMQIRLLIQDKRRVNAKTWGTSIEIFIPNKAHE